MAAGFSSSQATNAARAPDINQANTVPIAHLTDRAAIRVSGPDAAQLLHNVLTLDMPGVERHGIGYGALLTPQGKILWDFLLHKLSDGYAADLRAGEAEAFARRLALYRLRAKVEIAARAGSGRFCPMAGFA
jgi:folate-binding Fe-S cluster repair protein YgfZ